MFIELLFKREFQTKLIKIQIILKQFLIQKNRRIISVKWNPNKDRVRGMKNREKKRKEMKEVALWTLTACFFEYFSLFFSFLIVISFTKN